MICFGRELAEWSGEDLDWLAEAMTRVKKPLLDPSLMSLVISDCDNSLCKKATRRDLRMQSKKLIKFMIEHDFPKEYIAQVERFEKIDLLCLLLYGNKR